MEPRPQHTPLKIARFADLGIGLRDLGDSWNMESGMLSGGGGDGSPPVGLGLELGRGSSHRPTGFTKSCGFIVFQLQELQLQSLIYKYMEAGLPVPNHLLLPIWKSVAGSLGGIHGSPYQLYSGFLGCGSLHLEYKNGIDPEPGRCRRTDGKKWRCSKEAVLDHKYCERHMHRGRQRSKKLVESPCSPPPPPRNATVAYVVNLTNFLVTKHTSALTLQVLGNAKAALAAFVSVMIFRNPVTVMGMTGFAVTIMGVVLYSEAKKRSKAQLATN
ncbi:growth-regulating factor 10-like [Hibiscus syriacus]|uniref:growth-regulating factor 10-like n=1 Tax=Hibiscus syriacus TaxID=106335 RepID=UPI001920473F|nr:growth-regulating factor 10-like [Hibiscus syriacus]